MQKRTEAFSEMEDNGFENEFLDALIRERSAIEKIEQEKEENSFMEETVTAPHQRKSCGETPRKKHLPDWRILHGRKKISATYSLGGTGWKQMQTGGTVIMSLVVPIFL